MKKDFLEPAGCCRRQNKKLNVSDWLVGLPESIGQHQWVEVQFKNTRKGYFLNSQNIALDKGDVVAVEAMPGHDIGEVTLKGPLVEMQIRKAFPKTGQPAEVRRVYRKARQSDLDKYAEAKAREHTTMIRARVLADDLKLNMKIGDVEFQGDGNKAIFYYIADERVDFRQLIKLFADEFRVRIEMKQIGARQEAGRIGGLGPCGRELCCASWMTSFVSVSTGAARHQDVSLNPQKLAGQCAKLKCCLNYEIDAYVEQIKKLPSREITLETADSTYYHFKTDIFASLITYSTDRRMAANLVTINADRAFDVINMNKRGERPLTLIVTEKKREEKSGKEFEDVVGQDSLTRFDKNRPDRGGDLKRKSRNKARRNQQGRKPNGTNKEV